MTDLEISTALALAIGWPVVHVCKGFLKDNVEVWVTENHHDSDWRVFDYTDWSVIGPIAARYNCFPYRANDGLWCTQEMALFEVETTPQRVIAMAVINGGKDLK